MFLLFFSLALTTLARISSKVLSWCGQKGQHPGLVPDFGRSIQCFITKQNVSYRFSHRFPKPNSLPKTPSLKPPMSGVRASTYELWRVGSITQPRAVCLAFSAPVLCSTNSSGLRLSGTFISPLLLGDNALLEFPLSTPYPGTKLYNHRWITTLYFLLCVVWKQSVNTICSVFIVLGERVHI